MLPFACLAVVNFVCKPSTKGLCGIVAVSVYWLCLARHTDELISLLPISLTQASPRAQGQEKGLKLSDTEVTDLQGELELAGRNGECSWEAAEKLSLWEEVWDEQPDPPIWV